MTVIARRVATWQSPTNYCRMMRLPRCALEELARHYEERSDVVISVRLVLDPKRLPRCAQRTPTGFIMGTSPFGSRHRNDGGF